MSRTIELIDELHKLLREYQTLERDLMHDDSPGKYYMQRLNDDLSTLLVSDDGVLDRLRLSEQLPDQMICNERGEGQITPLQCHVLCE